MSRDEVAQGLFSAPGAVTPSSLPMPGEGLTWVRPSGNLAFPFGPEGASDLYGRGVKVLVESGVADTWSEQRVQQAAVVLARIVQLVYRPGGSVRASLDGLADAPGAVYPSSLHSLSPNKRREVKRLCAVCTWAVATAASAWAKEAA